MPNPFREAAAAHSVAVDDVFGERLRLLPQAKGDFGSKPDPGRQVREFVGAVQSRPQEIRRQGAGANSQENAKLASAAWAVSFAASLGLDARAGDLVVRLEEPGEPQLRLAAALPIAGRTIHPADKV